MTTPKRPMEMLGAFALLALVALAVAMLMVRLADMDELRERSRENAERMDRLIELQRTGEWQLDKETGRIRLVPSEGK